MDMLPSPMMATNNLTYGGNKAFHNFVNDYSHISDPNLRRRLALSEIDKVPFGLYHVRAVVVAGVGFFLDSYDIFAINLITTFLGIVFWSGQPEKAIYGFGGNNGQLPSTVDQALKASTSAGIVIGQILFGWLADVFGRRKMYGIELGIILISTMNCALANPSPAMTSTGLLVFWRVMMGVGIGGDYPLSSVITSEFAPTRWRGAMMAAVFSMQGVGQLLAAIVALVVTVAFRETLINTKDAASCDYACVVACDRSWRIIVGFGALPACFALYYRITIPETPRYTFDVAQDVEKADADIKAYMRSQGEGYVDPYVQARTKRIASPSLNVPYASWPDVYSYFKKWRNLKVLIGTTMSWFFLDLAFYGLGLNSSIVLQAIGYASGPTLYHMLYNNAVGMIILACAGSLPGYWTAVFAIDTLGRKPLQVFGFIFLTLLFCVLGFYFHRLSEPSMLALYVLAQYVFNLGPNTTTFIIPGEVFPTRYRSTGHGLSAAMGKLGAILAQLISIPILTKDSPPDCRAHGSAACSPWLDKLMQIFALFMLCGTLASLLVPETKGITLEELAGELPSGSAAAAAAPSRRPWWNPWNPGRPAGFWYARAARSPRVGIMTSPELATRRPERGGGAGRPRGHGVLGRRGTSAESNDCGHYPRRPNTAASRAVGEEEGEAVAMPAAVLPGWGAGWGRVERAEGSGRRENIRLQDVGSLLR